MSDLRTENFLAILPSLQTGDILIIAETEDLPSSVFRIDEVGDGFITGYASFDDNEDEEEYGELYEEDYHLVQQVIIDLTEVKEE
jgi:hypothetical protein